MINVFQYKKYSLSSYMYRHALYCQNNNIFFSIPFLYIYLYLYMQLK